MDNLGNNQKPKGIDEVDLTKTDKRFGKHDFEATMFIVGIILLVVYLLNFRTINSAIGNFIGRTFLLIKPYSTIHFEKSKRAMPEIRFIDFQSNEARPLDTCISYDKDCIYIFDSFEKKELINVVKIDGEIKKVDCKFSKFFDFKTIMKRDEDRKSINDGLFIYCQYMNNESLKMACFNIGGNNYERYEEVKRYIDRHGADEDLVAIYEKDIGYDYKSQIVEPEKLEKVSDFIDAYNNFEHPGKFLKKLFECDFNNMVFLGTHSNFSNGMRFVVLNRTTSRLELYSNFDKKTLKSLSIPNASKAFYLKRSYGSNIYQVFDGMKLNNFELSEINEEFVLISTIKIPIDYDESLDTLSETTIKPQFNYGSHETINIGGHLYDADLQSSDLIDIANSNDVKDYGLGYYVKKDNTTVIFDTIELTSATLQYALFFQEEFMYFPDGYERKNTAYYDTYRQYLVAGQSASNPIETKIFLFSKTDVFTLNSSGIDEPVDEAHVTYEDGRLTIYFMNKNSIYRWQNSQEDIGNLKLRKLDINPEPIKTIR